MIIDKETKEILESLEEKDLDKDKDFLSHYLKARFVEDICEAMKEEHLSRSELARRLGKSRQYVSRILNESANFTLETVVEISMALNRKVTLRLRKEDAANTSHNASMAYGVAE